MQRTSFGCLVLGYVSKDICIARRIGRQSFYPEQGAGLFTSIGKFFFISLQPIRKDLCSLNSMFLNYDANPLQAQHPSGLLYLSPSTKQLAKTADGNMMIMLALL